MRGPFAPVITRFAVAFVVGIVALGIQGMGPLAPVDDRSALTPVIVLEARPSAPSAKVSVVRSGGTIGADLPLIGGFAAEIPSDAREELARNSAVRAVLPDTTFALQATTETTTAVASVFTRTIDAPKAWTAGYKGKIGINVAVLDSGIAPSDDLVKPTNRIVGWKDLVSGSVSPIDPHGHGTYIAGVIAGNGTRSSGKWTGVAPQAGLVGIRVFDVLGVATASRIVQGIQWAIANRSAYGIRVLNMSFSTNSTLSYKFDAVAYAAEQAWKAGIVVVASAGNLGPLPGTVLSPGVDPYVITVGATDDKGTVSRADDSMTLWSGRGPTLIDLKNKPDLVAPGVWDTSIRVPGSTVDLENPLSVRDTWYFDGSGTSPATGVVSGVVALMLQRRPTLVPDQVKYALKKTTTAAPSTAVNTAGAGYVNAYNATMSTLTAKDNLLLIPSLGGSLLSLVGIPDVKWRG